MPAQLLRRHWWLIPEVAAVVVLLALVLTDVGGPGRIRAEAGQRAAALLEQASPAQHHDHGHEVGADDRVYCGVDVFGLEPPGARRIEDVRTVYGYYFCAVGRDGLPYLDSYRADGPIVVQFSPASIQIAPPGPGYRDHVMSMMPDQYEDRCFQGLPDPGVAESVKRRYESSL